MKLYRKQEVEIDKAEIVRMTRNVKKISSMEEDKLDKKITYLLIVVVFLALSTRYSGAILRMLSLAQSTRYMKTNLYRSHSD